MADKSKIEWTDATWNPTRGCRRVSRGCENCYAERVAARFSGPGQPYEGLAKITPSGPRWTGKVRLAEESLTLPLRWSKPRRIFVDSMSDLFFMPFEWIDKVMAVMAPANRHTFQVLTKRPERAKEYFDSEPWDRINAEAWLLAHFDKMPTLEIPPKHIWLGVSVEDQATADERIPVLLSIPAAVRFVSYEPALGPVDFTYWFQSEHRRHLTDGYWHDECSACLRRRREGGAGWKRPDWVIVGGESGPGARPFDVQWARDTIRQCREAGVACFVKQLGSNPAPLLVEAGTVKERLWLEDRKGGDPSEWPLDLRVRQFPGKEE